STAGQNATPELITTSGVLPIAPWSSSPGIRGEARITPLTLGVNERSTSDSIDGCSAVLYRRTWLRPAHACSWMEAISAAKIGFAASGTTTAKVRVDTEDCVS